jgi:cell division protein FtsW
MSNILPFQKTDRMLAVTTFGLVLFGIAMVYSASVVVASLPPFLDDKFFVKRQIIAAILGFVGMLITANIDYRQWKKWAGAMLVITFGLLLSVLLFSKGEINGAHRWILIGGQTFQPSELAKLTFIIYLSAWLVRQKDEIGSITRTFIPYVIILGLVSALMLKEPDFGTLMIIIIPAIIIYYVAGLTWKQVVLGLLVVALSGAVVLTSPYRRDRVLTFLNPSRDPAGSSYHIKNISIAIGSGGAWGLGFSKSKQKRRFLPEPYTDSIFAVISEELGSVRSVFLIAVFCFLLYRGFLVAQFAPDLFGKLLAVGITSWFGFQAFINLGSMLHIVPLVGVPLPFVSYGGSNLVISLLAMGILLNISGQLVHPELGRSTAKRKRS